MLAISEALGPEGIISKAIPGFRYRTQQREMAEAVAESLMYGRVLICEAGTGTGKTFAYLVPSLQSGRKVIISTGTRNLQDQLFHRDTPLVKKALASPASVALLKGRANYLCVHRLENLSYEGRRLSAQIGRELAQVKEWGRYTRSGDIAELGGVPEDAAAWPLVTSTTDNCLGQECPSYSVCHLVEARRRAQEADVLVINHHLLCADLALKDEGFGEILPGADAFILDEAHQLPETASQFFGFSVTGRQLLDLARDSEVEYLREAGDLPAFRERVDGLVKAVRELRLSFGRDIRRGPWSEMNGDETISQALTSLRNAMAGLGEVLSATEGRGKGLDSCLARCRDLGERLDGLCDGEAGDHIRWYETQPQSFRLNRTPLDISDLFRVQMQRHPAAWIFTSATLAVGDSFSHFARQLGIDDADTRRWDSPFDYPRQALFYAPEGIPEPADPDFDDAVSKLAVTLIEASRGRAFLLYTSHRALRAAADYLADRLEFPLLVQGDAPRGELLERFRLLGNAVLLGTASFWEGVDVRGEALSCVIIDKLPFASPGDPVLRARIHALRQRGGNPFIEFQVPQAAIALKQGAGRLIRDESDRGVLVVCDPRLLSKGYGRAFLDSLPPMRRTRDLTEVKDFFSTPVDGSGDEAACH